MGTVEQDADREALIAKIADAQQHNRPDWLPPTHLDLAAGWHISERSAKRLFVRENGEPCCPSVYFAGRYIFDPSTLQRFLSEQATEHRPNPRKARVKRRKRR